MNKQQIQQVALISQQIDLIDKELKHYNHFVKFAVDNNFSISLIVQEEENDQVVQQLNQLPFQQLPGFPPFMMITQLLQAEDDQIQYKAKTRLAIDKKIDQSLMLRLLNVMIDDKKREKLDLVKKLNLIIKPKNKK